MSKARDLANAGTALTTVSATELGYLDGVTSAVQTQVDAKIAKSTVTAKGDLLVATGSGTVVAQAVGTNGQYLQADSTQADGVKWADVTTLPSQTGNSGKYLTTDGTTASWGTVGTTWIGRAGTQSSTYDIDYNGSLYIIGCGSGTILTSPDGITWTSRTVSGFTTNAVLAIRWVSFLNLWIAGGDNGCLATSPDGITWTARTANMSTNQINHINDNGSYVLAVGRGGGTTNTGGIIYSTDGINWTRKSQSLTVGPSYRMSVWNGTNWIVISNNATNNYLYSNNPPSGTWTVGADGSGADINFIYWDGTRHIVGNSSGAYRYSTSLTLGTTTSISGGNSYNAGEQTRNFTRYYNGRLYAALSLYYDFSTTIPASNTIFITNKPFAPGGSATTDQIATHWVGSTGRIMVANNGIYTTF